MPSNHLILCRPLLLPSIFPSIRVFSNESVLRTRWPKYWSFSFSISPSNEHSGLISFRMEGLYFFALQGTLKSLLQLQFKSINSLALSFLDSPTLPSIHDHWENHSLDWTDLCWQRNVSAFVTSHSFSGADRKDSRPCGGRHPARRRGLLLVRLPRVAPMCPCSGLGRVNRRGHGGASLLQVPAACLRAALPTRPAGTWHVLFHVVTSFSFLVLVCSGPPTH